MINKNFANRHHQMKKKKKTRNNLFVLKQRNTILRLAVKGKHECGKVADGAYLQSFH